MVVGTFLEPLATKVYAYFAPTPLSHQYNIQTSKIMERTLFEDSCCIDVGCHQGIFLKEMLRLSPRGIHFAAEPIPEMFHSLVEVFGNLKNVQLYECALSDAEGISTFQHVVSNPGYSGLLRRRYDRPDEEIEEIEVKTTRLDNLIPKHMAIDFIKVDVEGAEYQVFKGALETIKRCQPIIVFEHGLGGSDYYGTRPEDIYDLLVVQCGLRMFLMAEWLKSNGRTSLGRESFCEHFSMGRNFYFMAAP
jgi:FkbM family methyltransferase